jgi:hypothetical protein
MGVSISPVWILEMTTNVSESERDTDRKIDRQIDWQIDGQIDGQKERQIERQIDRNQLHTMPSSAAMLVSIASLYAHLCLNEVGKPSAPSTKVLCKRYVAL